MIKSISFGLQIPQYIVERKMMELIVLYGWQDVEYYQMEKVTGRLGIKERLIEKQDILNKYARR